MSTKIQIDTEGAVSRPEDLTPVQERGGLYIKREDLFRAPSGANGSKLRQGHMILREAQRNGATSVVSASSVISPQHIISATVCAELGLPLRLVIGATTPEKAVPVHASLRAAVELGAQVEAIKVGFNPALQRRAAEIVRETPGAFHFPYGIAVPDSYSSEQLRDLTEAGARQVENLPDETRTLVVPFGSGNTAVGILRGLLEYSAPALLERVVLVGIGPDRMGFLANRLQRLGLRAEDLPLEHIPLHPWFAEYADRMPGQLEGIQLHPNYEGKVVRYLDAAEPEWWTQRDGSTAFWIVGGPLA